MKRKLFLGIIIFGAMITMLIWNDYYKYRQVMDSVQIVHYIAGSGSGYSSVYLTAIVPMGAFCESRTAEAVRRYVICRGEEIPDIIQIVLYESIDKLKNGESYFRVTFRRECSSDILYKFTDF